MIDRIEFLRNEINKHDALYWKDAAPIISDQEYDKLVEELRKINPDDPLLNKLNTPIVSSDEKVKHLNPMLSLDKVYNVPDLIKWCEKVARSETEGFLIQLKYDGCSGELANGILSTRGDGIYGENITSKLPITKIVASGNLYEYVRGEILIEKETFQKIKGEYKTARNMVGGILNRDDVDLSQGKILTFIDFDMYSICMTLSHMKISNWDLIIDHFKNSPYPSDGLVIKLRDKQYAKSLGITGHHSKAEMALKFDNPTGETILLDVVLSVGKNNLTPVGKVKPVEISGVTVSNVNLHNYKYILDNNIYINDTVVIERAGDVIPDIVESKPVNGGINRKNIEFDKCPECGSEVKYIEPELVCVNPDCIGKRIANLMDSIRRIGIERLGEPTLRKIVAEYNIKDLLDIFNLTKNEILKLDGFAKTSADNLFQEINKIKENGVHEWQILSSLNLFGIGETLSKNLLKNRSLNELRKMSYNDLIKINGIGPERAKVLYEGLIEHSIYIGSLLLILKIKGVEEMNLNGITIKMPMNSNGVVYTLTGKMPMGRKEITKMIEEKGGQVKGISRETSYLVCDDVSSGSGKVKKAMEYEIPIITFDQLVDVLN